MKKLLLSFSVVFALILCSCGWLTLPYEKEEKTVSFTVNYDYGEITEGEATLLLRDSLPFFKFADYGIPQVNAGDVVAVTFEGDFLVQETYPSKVVETEDFAIKKVAVTHAPVVAVTVEKTSEGVRLKAGEKLLTSKKEYVVCEDGSIEVLGEKHVGETLYATLEKKDGDKIVALYDHDVTPKIMACCFCGSYSCDGCQS